MIRRFLEWFLGLMTLPDDNPDDAPDPDPINNENE